MTHRTVTVLAVIAALAVLTCGCAESKESVKEFVLPPGDADAGEETFLSLRCYDCHRIPGVDLPVAEEPGQVLVKLGGEVSRVKTYGDLLNSILNPSHRLAPGYAETIVSNDGESRMPNYNSVMTVRELIDIVAYLQTQYRVRVPPPTQYPPYGY